MDGPGQVHDDSPVSAILFGPGEQGVHVTPGFEQGGGRKGPRKAPCSSSVMMYTTRSRGRCVAEGWVVDEGMGPGPMYPAGNPNLRN